MKLLALYIFCCFIGIVVGTKMRKKERTFSRSGKLQTILLVVLLVTMGARIGANKHVISMLGQIGVSAFILTIFCMAGSVAFVFVTRKFLKFDRKGERNND